MKNFSLFRGLGVGVLLAGAAAGLVAACSITSDHFSCAVNVNGERVRCVDYTNVAISLRATAEALCRGIGGDFTIDSTCPNEGKVGGCQSVDANLTQVSWYYVSSIAPTADEAKGRCASGDTFIAVEGHPLSGGDMSVGVHDMPTAIDLASHD